MSADFWAGYVSGAAGILIGNPLDLIKVRLQAGSSGGPAVPPIATAASLNSPPPYYRAVFNRTAALATGAAAPVLGYGALNALLFVSYRQAEAVLTSSPATQPTPAATWLAGAVAGLATWIVSAPTELIKCRAQLALGEPANPAGASAGTPATAYTSPSSSPSSWAVARRVWRAEGLRGFFLGGTVTALRDSIGYGFYFWSYLLATDYWRRNISAAAADGSAADTTSPAATLLCGGLAGIVTWASVFPLDVIKTRVQAQALLPPKEGSLSASAAAPLLGSGSGGGPAVAHRLSTLAITRQAYREGGLAVFFRGLGVCSARAFVVNAVQWAVYEWIMRELGAGRGQHEKAAAA